MEAMFLCEKHYAEQETKSMADNDCAYCERDSLREQLADSDRDPAHLNCRNVEQQLEAQRDVAEAALQNLVTKIEAIAAHPGYQGVWALSDAHGIEYMGPDWAVELAAAHAALEGKA